jgi:hypothetical protein
MRVTPAALSSGADIEAFSAVSREAVSTQRTLTPNSRSSTSRIESASARPPCGEPLVTSTGSRFARQPGAVARAHQRGAADGVAAVFRRGVIAAAAEDDDGLGAAQCLGADRRLRRRAGIRALPTTGMARAIRASREIVASSKPPYCQRRLLAPRQPQPEQRQQHRAGGRQDQGGEDLLEQEHGAGRIDRVSSQGIAGRHYRRNRPPTKAST